MSTADRYTWAATTAPSRRFGIVYTQNLVGRFLIARWHMMAITTYLVTAMDDTEDLLIELLTRLVIAVEEIADAIQEAANDALQPEE